MKVQNIILILFLFFIAACDPDDIPNNAPDFTLGQPEIAGSGCQDSSVHLTDDGKGVTVDFQNFELKAGGVFRKTVRKTCVIAAPLDIPEGYQIAAIPGEAQGLADLKKGASVKVNLTSFLAGQEGGVASKFSSSEVGVQKFKVGPNIEPSSLVFSKCGGSVIIRTNMSVLLKSKNPNDASRVKLVNFSGETSAAFKLIWKQCKQD